MKTLIAFLLAALLIAAAIPAPAASPTSPYSQPHSGLMYRAHLYSNTPGMQLGFTGIVTSTSSASTLTIGIYDWDGDGDYDDYTADQWMGFGRDDYIGGGDFMLRVVATLDSAAPVFEERPIVGWDSDAGTVVVSPAFSAVVVRNEVVAVMHRLLCGKTKGLPRYAGTAALISTGDALGTLQSAVDSVYVPDLAGFGNDYFNYGNYWFHYLMTTDGANPIDKWSPVLDYVSASGLFTFLVDFPITATANDRVELVIESQVPLCSGLQQTLPTISITPTAAADSFTCWTAYGNCWLTGLYVEIGTQWASSADSCGFITDAAIGADISRIDLGDDYNAAAVGTIFSVEVAEGDVDILVGTDSTALMTDAFLLAAGTVTDDATPVTALGAPTKKVTGGAPFYIRPWRILITDGTIIKFVSAGAGTTGVGRASGTWLPAESGAFMH